MNLLEYYQGHLPISEYFIPRKCTLHLAQNINLYGVRGAGKSALVADYLAQAEDTTHTLYIDWDDPNLLLHPLELSTLQQFINANHITLLVLDHFTKERLSSLPQVQNLIVISRIPLENTSLSPIELFPLDYEEFLAFESTPTQGRGLNHFLRSGTLPLMARSQKSTPLTMKNFFQSAFHSQEQKLLLILAQHHTKHLTSHQIYTFAKEHFKVSKDWIYRTIKAFQKEKLLFFLDDYYQKSGKKMLLFDFAFAKYLTLGQPFILQFDTMVALALIKHHIMIHTLGIHGYLTKEYELIIPAPFESEESLWVKSQNKFGLYKKFGIQKVTIVTVANHYSYTIKKLFFEALPFDEWSVLHNES